MKRLLAIWEAKLTLRSSLIVMIACLLFFTLNQTWQAALRSDLKQKENEYAESRSVLDSKRAFQEMEKDLKAMESTKTSAAEGGHWSEIIPPLVNARQLILRQRRPMGSEKSGKWKQDKILIQVDGSAVGVLGFLHDLASLKEPIYVSRFFITSEIVGSGFVTAELVLVRLSAD